MAAITDDVFFATLTELNARLRDREFKAVDLAKAFSDRLEQIGPRYNALALSLRDLAIRKAEEVDGDLKRGRFRGPLQGIPYGAKDLLSVAGRPTAWGAKPYSGQVFDYDATVIRKLAKSAAVLTGKLAMVELAGGGGYGYPSASVTGPGLTPWDRTRWAGGSSSGSGSAVAAGLVTFALGSETWGSILTPSAYCGVTGLRPTYGYVSRSGAMALSWTMDKIGPLCRSAEDCGHVLRAISGGDSSDPSCAGKTFYYSPKYARKLSDLRVGFAQADIDEWAEPVTRPAFQQAVEAIRGLGVKMIELSLPDLPYGLVAGTVVSTEGSCAFQELIESGRVNELADEQQIKSLKEGLEIPAKDYLRAMRIRSVIKEEMGTLLSKVDFLVSPSLFNVASPANEPLRNSWRPKPAPKERGLHELGAAGNLAGLPALSLPCGLPGNLPVAIQIVGRPFSENNLLALGVAFQKETDWHRRRPPL